MQGPLEVSWCGKFHCKPPDDFSYNQEVHKKKNEQMSMVRKSPLNASVYNNFVDKICAICKLQL